MKKLFALALALALMLSLAACGGNTPANTTAATANPTGAAESTPTAAATAENAANSGGNVASVPGSAPVLPAGWPATWPAEIPAIAGTLKDAGGDLHAAPGLSVSVEVADAGVFKDWVDSMVEKGFAKVYDTDTGGGNLSVCVGNTAYTVTCSFLASANLASIGVIANP